MYSGIGIDIGNGGPPPEWGVRMSIWDAMFHYGPWTDKQRCEIQDYFFPNSHRHHVPTKKLVPGQQRIATSFDTYIEFMNGCCLRVPTREKSKVIIKFTHLSCSNFEYRIGNIRLVL